MADNQARIQAFKDLPWEDKISQLVDFYEAMIKKTDNPEYINKFEITINRLKSFENNEDSVARVVDLYEKILEAEKKTQERKKKESEESLNKGQEIIKQIKQKESETAGDDPDDFLQSQL